MPDTTGLDMSSDEGTKGNPYKPTLGPVEERIAVGGFHILERLLLILVALLTLAGAATEMWAIWQSRTVSLADILLMFLYTEVIGMVAVFYSGRAATFVYPIFIAITALARLIVLQGKEMAPENIVFEAASVLLLTISAILMIRMSKT